MADQLLPQNRPRILDLCCGAGGMSAGYDRAGFDVIGVDIAPQPHYPFEFYKEDGLEVLRRLIRGGNLGPYDLEDFDAAHASFPCQAFTAYRRKGHGVGDGYPDLITPGRRLLQWTCLPYVIENVEGAPLIDPVRVCGTAFPELDVQRHRLFESNILLIGSPCMHKLRAPRYPGATNRKPNSRRTVEIGVRRIPLKVQQRAMGGVAWMTREELSQAIPPAYGEHIGRFLMRAVIENEEVADAA